MKKFKYRDLILFFLAACVISSCVPSKPAEEEKIIPADRLIKKIEANRRKVKTFKGTGILQVESTEMSASADFEIQLKRPDTVKVSIFGPFGIVLAQSYVTKDDFMFFDVMRNNLYKGSVKSDVLKRIFKVELSFDELLDAFTGSVNLTDKLRFEPDKYSVLEDGYSLTYIDSVNSSESVYKINSADLAIENYRYLHMPKEIILEGRYSNFKVYDEIPIPFTSSIIYYAKNQKLKIEYKNVEINPDLKDISLIIPDDINVIKW